MLCVNPATLIGGRGALCSRDYRTFHSCGPGDHVACILNWMRGEVVVTALNPGTWYLFRMEGIEEVVETI